VEGLRLKSAPAMRRRTVVLLALLAVIIVGGVMAQHWLSARERLEACGFDETQVVRLTDDADERVLFIGNSFIGNHGVDEMVRELLLHAEADSATSFRVWGPGMTLSQHVGDVGSPRGQCLRTLLTEADAAVRSWNLVVLQEQSFVPTQADHLPEMRAAAKTLSERAQRNGARVLLLSTWGYRDGLPDGDENVQDFTAMTRTLDTNTRAVAESLAGVDVAPVGLAFAKVHDECRREGNAPMAPGSPFAQLFAPDGRHPSPRGSYLAACVVYGAYTGSSPVGIDWAPDDIPPRTRDHLQAIAASVVFETP